MKKTTSENLSKRLVKYSAFSAAILGIANASGQIIYTDITDETVDALNPRVAIDINNDAIGDYVLGAQNSPQNFAFMFPASASSAMNYNSNGIVGFDNNNASAPYFYASNLAPGAIVDSNNSVNLMARTDFNYDGCYSNSQFCDGEDGYVGLHIKIGANTHYGWVRIQVAASGENIIIKDYAYNSVPDEPILVGQTTLNINNISINNIRVVALDKIITLYNLPESTSYNLFSTSGQSVLKGITNNQTYKIEASTLSTGVYILEMIDSSTNSMIRKKIVL